MGTIAEDLTGIKNIEDTLTSNKVATFAYTEQAYQNNDANGVTLYDVDKPQNIPVAQPNILKVNETILAKGWRSQASSIPRMLMNHFLGRCSYNLNKINDLMSSLLTTLLGHLGTANGIATLDASGKLPSGQIPTSVVQSVNSHSPSNGNVDISKSDVGLGSVVNTGDSATPAQGGTEKFTTGGAYTLETNLSSAIDTLETNLSSDIDTLETNLGSDIDAVEQSVTSHINNTSNPHNVTKAQVELGNVVNTGDSSTPTQGGTQKFTTGGAYDLDQSLRTWVSRKARRLTFSAIRLKLSTITIPPNGQIDLVVSEGSATGDGIGVCLLDIDNDTSRSVKLIFWQKKGNSVYQVHLLYADAVRAQDTMPSGDHLVKLAGVVPNGWGSWDMDTETLDSVLADVSNYDYSPIIV